MNKANGGLTRILAMNVRALTVLALSVLTINTVLIAPVAAEGLADPTRPNSWTQVLAPGAVTPQAPSFALESIIYSSFRRVAVINGRTLAEGESLGELTLLKVDRREVTVRIDGQRQVLLLKPISDVRR